jgi:hypothetical protein
VFGMTLDVIARIILVEILILNLLS